MNKLLLTVLLAAGVAAVSTPTFARRGADDPAGHVRQCRGCDDPAGHVRGGGRGRGADDPAGHVRQGRGADDPVGHVRGGGRGRGADDPVGHVRGQHADGHISGRDRVR